MQVERVFPFIRTGYHKDKRYIKMLAKNSGTKPENLSAIIGQQELIDLLKNAQRKSFYPGDIKEGQFDESTMQELSKNNYAFNLHIHTTASDGSMSPSELLDKSSRYADLLNKNTGNFFTIAITDHDTMQGDIDIVNEVSSNPEKYKNLKIVLGVELSSQYVDKEKLKKPVTYEMVAYCVNPYDKKAQDFLDKLRLARIKLAKQIVEDAYIRYPQYDFSYEEACKYSNNPKKGINGFLYSLANYFKLKAPDIDTYDLSLKYLPKNEEQSSAICYKGEDIKDVFENTCAFYAVAHPARINFNSERTKNNISQYEIFDNFINYLKKTFGKKFKAIETNYYGYKGDLLHAGNILNNNEIYDEKYKSSIEHLLHFRKIASENSLLEAGGMDSHYESPFAR